MNDLVTFLKDERPTNELEVSGKFWGSRLIKLSVVQYAFMLDTKKSTAVSFKMLMGEYVQATLIGDGKGCELQGDAGGHYFTFDKISYDKKMTFMGKDIVFWANDNEQLVYVEHKYVGDASYRFYGLTLMQIVAYYGWSLEFPVLQSAPFKTEQRSSINLDTYRKRGVNEMLFAIVIDSSKIMTFALPCMEIAHAFSILVAGYYTAKGRAIRQFMKDKNWSSLKRWDRENSPKEDKFIEEALDLFTIKFHQIP